MVLCAKGVPAMGTFTVGLFNCNDVQLGQQLILKMFNMSIWKARKPQKHSRRRDILG